MELDAEERYKRKQENLRLSNELKEKGNVEYQNKNYEKAIEFYSEVFDYMILLTFELNLNVNLIQSIIKGDSKSQRQYSCVYKSSSSLYEIREIQRSNC